MFTYGKPADGTVKCVEDEIPFEVPDGWAWCRLGEICEVLDIDHKMPLQQENGIPYISPLNFFGQNQIDFNSAKKISEEDFIKLSKKCTPKINDIIFPRYGTIGRVRLIETDIKFLVSYSCAIIKNSKFYNPKYMYYFLQSSWIQKEEIKKYINESTQPNIGLASILKFLIPLPPLVEQKAIVAKIEEIFTQIDILENNKTDLQTTIKHAKSKILDLAIHGKLVPQNPNDEAASKLLDRIHSNCEFDEGKQSKRSEKILHNGRYEKLEDVPFDIPDGWAWCRLIPEAANCLDNFRKPINATERTKMHGNIPYYGATGQVGWINDFLTNEELILLGEDGAPFLDKYKNKAYKITGKAWVNNHAHILKSNFGSIGNSYLLYYLNVMSYENIVQGTTRLKLTQESLKSVLIPLPPLAEQKRIVTKIESLFSLLDKIQSELN